MNIRNFARLLFAALVAICAQAHIGSPDVYLDDKAGPYQLFVTIRPPQVIPGVAALEIRSESPGVTGLRAVPLPIGGAGAKFAPVPDELTRSKDDPQFFTGSLWMMAPGSWQVRVTAVGNKGQGILSIPVPSVALTTRKMQTGIGLVLSLLGLFLVGGMVAIAGASVREVKLAPGLKPGPAARRKGNIAMAVALLLLVLVLWSGNAWWKSEADQYRQTVYRPIQMNASLDKNGLLTLNLADSGWLQPTGDFRQRHRFEMFLFHHSIDDLVPDHNHLMHLYAIRGPGLDAVYHLHPDLVEAGEFHLQLPNMVSGSYRLYADVVHANGFAETPVAHLIVPSGLPGRALSGDDSAGSAQDWMQSAATNTNFTLPDGYRMEWLNDTPLHARQGMNFRFRLLDANGRAPDDIALYMGMLGHAAFLKTDGTVFAHVHPMGTASMAAVLVANGQTGSASVPSEMSGMEMPGMEMPKAALPNHLPNEVSFPYGFPAPGRYRLFVQMKHGNTIETGVFDAIAH